MLGENLKGRVGDVPYEWRGEAFCSWVVAFVMISGIARERSSRTTDHIWAVCSGSMAVGTVGSS